MSYLEKKEVREASAVLQVFAQLFAPLSEAAFSELAKSDDWQGFTQKAHLFLAEGPQPVALDLTAADLVNLPSHQQLSAFYSCHFTGGLPQSVMAVESPYRPWTTRAGAALIFGGQKGYCQGDAACHMRHLYQSLDIQIARDGLQADHISMELSFAALLIRHGQPTDFIGFFDDHLTWLPDFYEQMHQRVPGSTPENRFMLALTASLIGFLRLLQTSMLAKADALAKLQETQRGTPSLTHLHTSSSPNDPEKQRRINAR